MLTCGEQGYLDVATSKVEDGAINRSLYAYRNNPQSERDQYEDETDKTLTLLRFQRASDEKNIGVLTWYPVHPTSLLGNNTHVAGDNKGVAAWMLEQELAGDDSAAEGFVAGFSQANVGDTTPNVLGAYCDDGSGDQCSYENSTCADGKSQSCHGRGPFFRELDLGVKSCHEIGLRQFTAAKEAYVSVSGLESLFPVSVNDCVSTADLDFRIRSPIPAHQPHPSSGPLSKHSIFAT